MAFGKRSFNFEMTESALSFSLSEMRLSATFEPSSGEVSHAVVSRAARGCSISLCVSLGLRTRAIILEPEAKRRKKRRAASPSHQSVFKGVPTMKR